MIGLIKKDLLMIKSNSKVLVILFIIYGIMIYQGQIDLSFILPFMSVMVMISTFSYDTYNKWDAYTITLPNGRKNSVKAKYLATLLVIFITTIITTILSFIISYTKTHIIDYEYILMTLFGCVFATIILESIMYPTIYKFGVEKARIGIFIIVFGIAIIGGLISNYIDLSPLTKIFNIVNDYWVIVIPIIMIIILYISYKISERIYINKEY